MSLAIALFTSTSRRNVSTFTISNSQKLSRSNIFSNPLKVSSIEKEFSTMTTESPSSDYHTVAITGSSGLLGTALIDELTKKENGLINGKPMKIVKLIRSKSITNGEGLSLSDDEMVASLNWNPNAADESSQSTIDSAALESIDTVVHLAGENVGSGLLPGPLGALGIQAWSDEKKDLIMSSRVGPTKALATAIGDCKKPTNFIVASGVGVYGSNFMAEDDGSSSSPSPDESFDIQNTKGFLAEVSRQWEAASLPAAQGESSNENRVVNLRLAPIMSKFGGALGKLYPIFFLGGGGIVGSGKQYFSYISARDAARAIVHTIETPSVNGPVNLVAPTPCTNSQFTSALGKVLSRPTIIPLPEFAVKALFGEMGEEVSFEKSFL